MKNWIEGQIQSGKYHNASEYVRDRIRKDQGEQEKLETLRAAIAIGRESGISYQTIEDIWQDIKSRLESRNSSPPTS